jgi:hypothetical protein
MFDLGFCHKYGEEINLYNRCQKCLANEENNMEVLKQFAEELSNDINSEERWFRLTDEQNAFAKEHDIVVVYGYSDDNVEFDGAIRDEVGAWEGAIIPVNADGPMEDCECECKYSKAALKNAKKITAFWCFDWWDWSFKTDIPHETFEFYSDGEPYCKGIVFYKKDMA